jgi:hypothetical protein
MQSIIIIIRCYKLETEKTEPNLNRIKLEKEPSQTRKKPSQTRAIPKKPSQTGKIFFYKCY